MAEEEEEAAWDLDARGAAFLKRFLTRFQVQAVHRELYGAWRVWLDKFKEEKKTRRARARRARHDAMLATLREHAPGDRDPAVVAGLVAWASSMFAGADAAALSRLCQHLAVTERAPGDLLWLQGDVADTYYILHAGAIKLLRHSTPIMTRECRDLYGDRRAVLRRRPHEILAHAAALGAGNEPARDDETPALQSPAPAPTPAPAPSSHVAEAPAPARGLADAPALARGLADAPAPARGLADAPAPAAGAPAPARVSADAPAPAAGAPAPAEAEAEEEEKDVASMASEAATEVRPPRPEPEPEWDTLGVVTKDVAAGTGLGEGALLRSVGVTGASGGGPYVNTAACVEPCVVLEVRGEDYRRAFGGEHLRRVEIMQTRKFFRELGPFKRWRPESFMQLAEIATKRNIPAHAVVAWRGAACDAIAFVLQGELRLEGAVMVGDRRETVDLLRLGPGSMLGDVEISEGLPRHLATVTATRRSVVLQIERAFFETLLDRNDGAIQRRDFERIVNARREVQAKAALDALVRSGAATQGGAAPPAYGRICDAFETALEGRVATALKTSYARSPPEAAAALQNALARRPARRDGGASRAVVVKELEHSAKIWGTAPIKHGAVASNPGSETAARLISTAGCWKRSQMSRRAIGLTGPNSTASHGRRAIGADDGPYSAALDSVTKALREDSIRDARRTASRRRSVTRMPADLIGTPSISDTADVHAAHASLKQLSAITDRQRGALPSDALLKMTRDILSPDIAALKKQKDALRRRPGT